jgi:hypothetical protein
MKKFLICGALLSAFLVKASPQEHRSHTKTYSLLPAQTLNLVNKTSHEVEIRSEYPIQIAAGPCHANYTVQWHCSFNEPADLFIRDLRVPPVFSTPRANAVTVTASED